MSDHEGVTRTDSLAARRDDEQRGQRLMLMVVRLLFMVMLVSVTLLAAAARNESGTPEDFEWSRAAGLFVAAVAFGVIVILVDVMTPNKRLTSMVGVYMGVCTGLIGALAVGALVDVVAEAWDIDRGYFGTYFGLAKVIIAIVLCYLAVSVVLTTKDDFRLVIPYVEFAKQVRGIRPLLLDTSALIDGRIQLFAQSGFLDAPLIVPQFVIDELQRLADSADKLKRERGRRGLDMVRTLQNTPLADLSIDSAEVVGRSVDHMLLAMAESQNLRIVTTDYNLRKVAQIREVTVLNLNELANTLRPVVVPGDPLEVEITKRGEGAGQGVGYLPDGTMVVVEDAAERMGESVTLIVTNSLQTTAGRMIFARLSDAVEPATDDAAVVEHMAEAATHQPRAAKPTRRPDGTSRRNPRR